MDSPHAFHIPVMGTGFSLDTPLRVARFGISSVMSLVDDSLIERVRRHYCTAWSLAYEPIRGWEPDARARRITAWLDLVDVLVARQVDALRSEPFSPGSDKTKYFELLPHESALARAYGTFLAMPEGSEKERAATELTRSIVAGSCDVNIMTKLDRLRTLGSGLPRAANESDAKAALRGFAASSLASNLVLSAGMNPTLFGLLESFPDFYRDARGHVRKGVVLKVSDFRSALVQGKFLAKKGIEIAELRIESGLNCGGHAFATDGELLGPILRDFKDKRESLAATLAPAIAQYYEKKGLPFVGPPRACRVTVQGGIGTAGEVARLCDTYGADGTGWATPFLLVREATAVDDATRRLLAAAKEEDLYVSDASPLGVPFNNVRGSSSELWTTRQIEAKRPGSNCPRGYLASNTELSKEPICVASREYQLAKVASLGCATPPSSSAAGDEVKKVYAKSCICHHLGNGALIDLGEAKPGLPVAVCPGPNVAYFDREYTLREMVDHIYGRGPSLVPATRPHLFAKELAMFVDHLAGLVDALRPEDAKGLGRLASFEQSLRSGIEHYRALVAQPPMPGENLASLAEALETQGRRLDAIWVRAHRTAEARSAAPVAYA